MLPLIMIGDWEVNVWPKARERDGPDSVRFNLQPPSENCVFICGYSVDLTWCTERINALGAAIDSGNTDLLDKAAKASAAKDPEISCSADEVE